MTHLYRSAIEFVRGNKDKSHTPLQRAQSILKAAKIDVAPDDQFEIDWLRGKLEKSVRD